MNFYPHHIGDYLTATAHLTWLEDCAYRRLLDVYYSREQAIPGDIAQAARLVRATSKDERKAVETVLSEFFVKMESGWVQFRCDEEIQKAKASAERAKANGSKGGRPAKRKPTANPDETQWVNSGLANGTQEKPSHKAPNPNPNTNYSEPIGSGSELPKPGKKNLTPDEIIFGYGVPLLTNAGTADKQARSFLGGLRKSHGDEALVNALRDCIQAKPLQPLEWLAKVLPPMGATPKLNPQEALEAANRAVGARFLASRGMTHETE